MRNIVKATDKDSGWGWGGGSDLLAPLPNPSRKTPVNKFFTDDFDSLKYQKTKFEVSLGGLFAM